MNSSDKINADRFLGFAKVYDDSRPKVPEQAVDIITDYLGRQPERVVDLGCGTGLSTMVWKGHAREVIGIEPSEILRRAYYGYDAETYTTDGSGNRMYGQFNPNRDYFTYNGYGNLVSTDYKYYTGYLDKYAIEAMSENRRYIDSIEQSDELAALFDELENTEN